MLKTLKDSMSMGPALRSQHKTLISSALPTWLSNPFPTPAPTPFLSLLSFL